jgi:hypothetical protein
MSPAAGDTDRAAVLGPGPLSLEAAIFTPTSVESVGVVAAEEAVHPIATQQPVGAGPAAEDIRSTAAANDVISAAGAHDIWASTRRDDVGAIRSRQQIRTIGADHRHRLSPTPLDSNDARCNERGTRRRADERRGEKEEGYGESCDEPSPPGAANGKHEGG